MEQRSSGPVVVGVQADTADVVLDQAARCAAGFGVELVCVQVEPDPALVVGGTIPSGVAAFGGGLDLAFPDLAQPPSAETEARVRDRVAVCVGDRCVSRVVVERGDPATTLSAVADREDAAMIVVGTRETHAGFREFFGGSVAVQLTHHQRRPVLVVPTHPVGRGQAPWEQLEMTTGR